MVEYFYVKFVGFSYIDFWNIVEKTDKHNTTICGE